MADTITRALESIREEVGWLKESISEHCACLHDGRGSLTTECEEHRTIREQRDDLLSALRQVEAEMRAGFGSSNGETREQVRRAIAKAEGK